MLGPISKVHTLNAYDALAEIPVLGTVTSAVRLAHTILTIACNILKYPVCQNKLQLRNNIKVHLVELRLGLIEIIPIYGNFYAFKMNKALNNLSNNLTSEELKTVKSYLAKRVIHERQKFFVKINQMSEADLRTTLDATCNGTYGTALRRNNWQNEVFTVIQKNLTLMKSRAENIAEINELSKEELAKKIQNVKTKCKPELKEFWREYLEKMEHRFATMPD